MFEFVYSNLLWSQGHYILLGSILVTIVAYLIRYWLAIPVLIFILFCLYFFRNPERICPEALTDNAIIVCPADGKVVAIEQGNFLDKFAYKISIFLSPFDVHVNWIPVTGVIESINYKPGKFVPAFVDKSSELNERNDLLIRDLHNRELIVRQIAGIVARRIVCWAHAGEAVKAGQKFGMIKFGSRVDIFLPKQVAIAVGMNERVYGGQTILGRWL